MLLGVSSSVLSFHASESLRGCAVQIGMLGVIVSAIMVIMIGYLMVGISGYLAFPTTVEGNVLNSFTRGDVIMQVCVYTLGARITALATLWRHILYLLTCLANINRALWIIEMQSCWRVLSNDCHLGQGCHGHCLGLEQFDRICLQITCGLGPCVCKIGMFSISGLRKYLSTLSGLFMRRLPGG